MQFLRPDIFITCVFAALAPNREAGAGGIYWTNRGASLVERAGFDGTGRTTVLGSAGTNVRGLALDIEADKIYYADNGGDTLYRMTLDGQDRVALLVTGPSSFPADLRLDLRAGHLYYCDQQKAHLRRLDLDGTHPLTLVTDAVHQPYYLDLDLVNGKIYWGDFDGATVNTGNVFRMNLDGSSLETVVTGTLETRGVGVDPVGGMLYWANRNAGRIMRCPLAALPVDAASSPAVQTLYANLDTPHGLQLDIPAGKIYWVDTATNGVPNTRGDRAISRGDMDGRGPHEVLVDLGSEPWDVDVDPRCRSYGEWTARFFPRDPGPAADPAADPDGDGVPNTVEFGLGMRPLFADPEHLPTAGILNLDQRDFPTLTFTRRLGAADGGTVPQHSFDAQAWWDQASATGEPPRLAEVSRTPGPENIETVTVRSTLPLQEWPRQFLRLRVRPP